MIVKDEAHIIAQCLNSVLSTGLFSYVSIVDTGSKDNTIEVIKNTLKGYTNVNMHIKKYNFTSFDVCRNIALDGLRGKTEYGFWIDADEILVSKTDGLLENKDAFLQALDKSGFFQVKAFDEDITFYRNNFFKITDDLKWRGLVHEYLGNDAKQIGVPIMDFDIIVSKQGHSWQNPEIKYRRYISLLNRQIELEPNEPRWVYFLADTYRLLKDPASLENALALYEKRINKMPEGNPDEKYIATVMYANLYYNLRGRLPVELLTNLDNGYNSRIEHYMLLIKFLCDSRDNIAAFLIAQKAIASDTIPFEGALVSPKTYLFTRYYFHVYLCLCLDKPAEAVESLKKLKASMQYYATEQEKRNINNWLETIKIK